VKKENMKEANSENKLAIDRVVDHTPRAVDRLCRQVTEKANV